jgi:hypothetical protein
MRTRDMLLRARCCVELSSAHGLGRWCCAGFGAGRSLRAYFCGRTDQRPAAYLTVAPAAAGAAYCVDASDTFAHKLDSATIEQRLAVATDDIDAACDHASTANRRCTCLAISVTAVDERARDRHRSRTSTRSLHSHSRCVALARIMSRALRRKA